MTHSIPTIDISPLRQQDAAARRRIAKEVGEAARIYGFMKLVGHGVPAEAIAAAMDAARRFFAEPDAVKRRVVDRRNNRGFIPMFDSVINGMKPSGHEAFSMGHIAPPSDPALLKLPFYAATPWPETPGFRESLEACYAEMFRVGEEVLSAFAVDLGVAAEFFANLSVNTYSNMRVLHYPPMAAVSDVTDGGVQPHEDQGLVTMLVQDMNGGLDVMGPDGDWLPVVPDADAIVLNVGKLLTQWTNGRLKSAMHRVINYSHRERYSIPLFMHPNYHQLIDPNAFSAGTTPRYDTVVAGEQVYANFRKQRPSWREAEAGEVRSATR